MSDDTIMIITDARTGETKEYNHWPTMLCVGPNGDYLRFADKTYEYAYWDHAEWEADESVLDNIYDVAISIGVTIVSETYCGEAGGNEELDGDFLLALSLTNDSEEDEEDA